jgi:GntR family transcriptional regulator
MDIRWKIDKTSPLPYYYQLECLIQQSIEKGLLKTGDLLLSEGEIAATTGLSVGVVRQALKRLEIAQVISRQKGKKAVITARPKTKLTYLADRTSLYSELIRDGFKVHTRILKQVNMLADGEICDALEIGPNQKVIQLLRVRSVNGKPMIFWITYLNNSLCPGIDKINLRNRSLIEILQKDYDLRPYSSEETLEIVAADSYLSSLLHVPIGDPIVNIVHISRLKNGHVMEYFQAWHVARGWKFNFKSKG